MLFGLSWGSIGEAVCLSHTPLGREWLYLYEMTEKQALEGVTFMTNNSFKHRNGMETGLSNKKYSGSD